MRYSQTEIQIMKISNDLLTTIETNSNIRTVQSELFKFASVLFDQIPNRRVVGTDWNAIC